MGSIDSIKIFPCRVLPSPSLSLIDSGAVTFTYCSVSLLCFFFNPRSKEGGSVWAPFNCFYVFKGQSRLECNSDWEDSSQTSAVDLWQGMISRDCCSSAGNCSRKHTPAQRLLPEFIVTDGRDILFKINSDFLPFLSPNWT